jgi:AraC family transcriptional regulator
MIDTYAAGLRHTWHCHEQAVVTLLLQGHVRENVGSHDVIVGPLAVGIKPIGIRHADHFGTEGVRALRLEFLPDELSELGRYAAALETWRWLADNASIRAILAAFLFEHATDARYQALAALDIDRHRRAGWPPRWLATVRESVADCYRQRISLSSLATLHDVHPVYLAREFRRHYGESVGQCIRRLRLHDAVSRLLHHDSSLAAIALRCGFSDQAHMTRLMQFELGTTPGMLRGRLRNMPVRVVQDSRDSAV